MKSINLAEKLATVTDYGQPRTVAEFDKHDLRVVKLKGEFPWHKHENADEVFLVLQGQTIIHFRDGSVKLGTGELYVVLQGVEHRTVTATEAHVLLIQRSGTTNTVSTSSAALQEHSKWSQ